MTDEFALRRATDRAAKARAVVDSDIVKEAFDALAQAYVDAWLATDPRDTDGRERLWLARTVLTKFRGQFETAITDGKIAMAELNEIDAKAKSAERF